MLNTTKPSQFWNVFQSKIIVCDEVHISTILLTSLLNLRQCSWRARTSTNASWKTILPWWMTLNNQWFQQIGATYYHLRRSMTLSETKCTGRGHLSLKRPRFLHGYIAANGAAVLIWKTLQKFFWIRCLCCYLKFKFVLEAKIVESTPKIFSILRICYIYIYMEYI